MSIISLRGVIVFISVILALILYPFFRNFFKKILKKGIIETLIFAILVGTFVLFGLKRLDHALDTNEIATFASIIALVVAMISVRISLENKK